MRSPSPRKPRPARPASEHRPTQPTLIRRRRSSIHGHGVYACVAIPAGTVIIEYRGERITKAESARREAERLRRIRSGRHCSTFIFYLNKRHDLDGRRGGNCSRFINHSCDPNCRAEQHRGRIWIVAREAIAAGDEITFDYGFPLQIWKDNPCRCGTGACAGYIVAAGQRWRLCALAAGRAENPGTLPGAAAARDRAASGKTSRPAGAERGAG
jgi:uncharacterized protein